MSLPPSGATGPRTTSLEAAGDEDDRGGLPWLGQHAGMWKQSLRPAG